MRRSLAGALVVLAACWAAPRELPAGRPNFILILADDLSCDDLGAYGHPSIRTPRLDRLAAEGLVFDRAFVTASSCSPSRASLLTGRYPHQTDAEQLHWRLPPGQVAFVEPLRKAGYWTAAAGKWHLGDAAKAKFDLVREANPAGFIHTPGSTVQPGDAESGCADWVRTLRERPKGKPFFLWLASLDPHRDYREGILPEPHRAEDVLVPPYLPDDPEVRKDFALYYDEIARLDRFVGDVLDELARENLERDTVVIFLSDNGRPFPRCKTTLYDSGIRTPFLVRWPAYLGPARCEALVSAVDVAPTVLELARAPVPASVEGKSLVPLFRDPDAAVREYAFAEKNWHDYEDRARAVRSLKYKYIRNYYADLAATPPADAVRSPTYRAMRRLRGADALPPEQLACFLRPRAGEELYDTDADPHEMRNLVHDSRYAPVLKQFRRVLDGWEEATADAEPAARTPDEFDRETGEPLPNRVRPRPSKK